MERSLDSIMNVMGNCISFKQAISYLFSKRLYLRFQGRDSVYGCPMAEGGGRERLDFSFDFTAYLLIYFHSLKEKAVCEPISSCPAHCKHGVNVNYCCYCAGFTWRWVSGKISGLSAAVDGL